ncbi:hypothetical protein HUJ05_004554 [Dendroctonus ponderosae]|nr:hypothetical protein HUJ05_004554 [Dendroctonus ponderosae]
MDYLRRREGKSKLQRIRNEDIRRRVDAQERVLGRIERRGLRWFEQMMRMNEQRLPLRRRLGESSQQELKRLLNDLRLPVFYMDIFHCNREKC